MRVTDQLLQHREEMTPSERQLLNVLLDYYPLSGLGSITELAANASVSTTTVARLLQKKPVSRAIHSFRLPCGAS